MAKRFILNETSYHGAGAIQEIATEVKRRGFQRAFVASDPDLLKFGVTQKVLDVLTKAGVPYSIYSNIKPNPTIENVQSGVAAFKESGADFIIAVGGGSSIDTSKGIGIIIRNPEFADVRSLEGTAPTKNPCVPIIAVPTTAGTAAEVTINYVITDIEKRCVRARGRGGGMAQRAAPGGAARFWSWWPFGDRASSPRDPPPTRYRDRDRRRKFVCIDPHDIPIIAVVDPTMTYSMPKGLTAATGMDAMTHAIEGYITKAAWELSDMFHLKAVRAVAGAGCARAGGRSVRPSEGTAVRSAILSFPPRQTRRHACRWVQIEIIGRSLRGAFNNTPEGRDGMALAQYVAGMGE
jgi:lactaldehyde reductase